MRPVICEVDQPDHCEQPVDCLISLILVDVVQPHRQFDVASNREPGEQSRLDRSTG